MSVVAALAMWPGGIFADRVGGRWSIALGMGLMGGVWLLTISAPVLPVFAIGFLLAGVARAFIQPAFSAMVSAAVPEGNLGMTWGLFMTALGLLAVPAPYIGGLLYDQVGPEATFVVAAICALIAAPLAIRWLRVPAAKPSIEKVEL